MKKSAQSQKELLKNIILTSIVAGLTFTLLLVAILPFVGGQNTRSIFPTFERVADESDALVARLGCTSWQNVKINNCTLAEYNAKSPKCITTSDQVTLNLKSTGATKVTFKEFMDANSTYCENAKPDRTWKTQNMTANLKYYLNEPDESGFRKICAQFSDSVGRKGPVCGAVIQYNSPDDQSVKAPLTCKSWENVQLNGCTLAEWNKGPTANTKCNMVKPARVSARLTSTDANQYRYKLVPLANDCVKENMTAQPWTNLVQLRSISVPVPQQTTGPFVSGAKLCVQYRRYSSTGAEQVGASATSPTCGAAVRFRASRPGELTPY